MLGLLTRGNLPSQQYPEQLDLEDLALAMEQKLLHHYLLSESPDSRVVNKSFGTGREDNGKSIGYVIYMAFSYEESSTSLDAERAIEEGSSPPNNAVVTVQFHGTQRDPRLRKRPRSQVATSSQQPLPPQHPQTGGSSSHHSASHASMLHSSSYLFSWQSNTEDISPQRIFSFSTQS